MGDFTQMDLIHIVSEFGGSVAEMAQAIFSLRSELAKIKEDIDLQSHQGIDDFFAGALLDDFPFDKPFWLIGHSCANIAMQEAIKTYQVPSSFPSSLKGSEYDIQPCSSDAIGS